MHKREAREAILRKWQSLAASLRRNEHQAAVFALKAIARFDFRCHGGKYELIKGWLLDEQRH